MRQMRLATKKAIATKASQSARKRERARQMAIIDRLSAGLERNIQREIARVMNNAAKLAEDKQPVSQATDDHKNRIEKILYPHYTRVSELFTKNILSISKSAKTMPECQKQRTIDGMVSEFIQTWVARYGAEAVNAISETTREQIKAITQSILREGLSEADAGKKLRQEAARFSITRAQTISRTETHRAAMASSDNAASELPDDFVREWVAASGGDTRRAHSRADGQTVELKEPFIVDGERLRFPGDPSGSAANVINCRCVAIYRPRR